MFQIESLSKTIMYFCFKNVASVVNKIEVGFVVAFAREVTLIPDRTSVRALIELRHTIERKKNKKQKQKQKRKKNRTIFERVTCIDQHWISYTTFNHSTIVSNSRHNSLTCDSFCWQWAHERRRVVSMRELTHASIERRVRAWYRSLSVSVCHCIRKRSSSFVRVATSCRWWTARTAQFGLNYYVHCLILMLSEIVNSKRLQRLTRKQKHKTVVASTRQKQKQQTSMCGKTCICALCSALDWQ